MRPAAVGGDWFHSRAGVCFDIQDRYSPRVRLERAGSQIIVYRSGERRGVYDLATQTFRRHEEPFTPTYIDGEPPGDWWLRTK